MTGSLLDLDFAELGQLLADAGVNRAHTRQLWQQLYDARLDSLDPSRLSPPLARWVQAQVPSTCQLDEPVIQSASASDDGRTQKYLLGLGDGQSIETVIMGYPGRFTVCVSTQAGCAMGCVFCATGQMGLARQLRTGEIVAQVRVAQRQLRRQGEALQNVVLMGMGEPLHNYDAVMKALAIVTDARGLAISPRRVTINTVGLVPGIERMAAERSRYNLGVSLHASSDEERSPLLPINRRWPLAALLLACRDYCRLTGRKIFFSWTLIAGVNDQIAQAERLVGLLQGMNAHVNLIHLNETAGFAGREASYPAAQAFQAHLQASGVPCTVRQKRGLDVAAGCGQLLAPRKLRPRRASAASAPVPDRLP